MINDLLTFSIQNGVSQSTFLLLLLIPAVATLVTFFKVVIGLEYLQLSRGIFLSLGVASIGFGYGLLFFIIGIALDFLLRLALERRRLLPPAKHALSVLFASVVMMCLFIFAGYFTRQEFLSLDIIPVLLILVNSQGIFQVNPGDHPLRPVGWLLGMILFLYGGFLLLTSQTLQTFALTSPVLFLAVLLVLLLILGRFRGLRIVELFRFFRVISRQEP